MQRERQCPSIRLAERVLDCHEGGMGFSVEKETIQVAVDVEGDLPYKMLCIRLTQGCYKRQSLNLPFGLSVVVAKS